MSHSGKLAAALMAGAMLSASPAAVHAQDHLQAAPVAKVGILDMKADELIQKDANTSIQYREFQPAQYEAGHWRARSGYDHGRVVASSFVQEYRKIDPISKIEIYSANAYAMNPHPKVGQSDYAMNYEGAVKALEWMRSNGVKVVVTAFNVPESGKDRLQPFMDKAHDLGMTIFASGSNTKDAGIVYPAADPQSISIADNGPDRDAALRKDASINKWMDYAMDSTLKIDGRDADWGSSFASARAAAYGSYYAMRKPDVTRDEIDTAIKRFSPDKHYNVGSTRFQMPTIGQPGMAGAFRGEIDALNRNVVTASLSPQRQTQVAAAGMAAAGMVMSGR